MKKNCLIWNISTFALVGTIISSQLVTISCTTISNNDKDLEKNNLLLKEKDTLNKINENSKLSDKKKEEERNKQKEAYSHLNIDYIDDYLLEKSNITLRDYFINYHKNLIRI